MAIYVIGDLHLGFSVDKPMDIFGENWKNHHLKIKKNWLEKVKDDDYVILAGDSSWAMYLSETKKDFEWIDNLPGTKIFLKGNHDYWWTSLTKMKKAYPNFLFLHNNSFLIGKYEIVGTRAWSYTVDENEESDNYKIFKRECARLKLSIEHLKKNFKNNNNEKRERICILHYPPFNTLSQKTELNNIIESNEISRVYFGHIHSSFEKIRQGLVDGVEYRLISADYLDFDLVKIGD